MAAEKIGDAKCPLCKASTARVSLSKSGLAVLTCNACNCQVFTRSGRSDEHVRSLILVAPPVAPPAAVAAPIPPARPIAAPVVAPAPVPAQRGFGLMKW